jgi:hypothetical protein
LPDSRRAEPGAIVSAYLDFAELQARSRKPMYMRDWILKLDDFIRLAPAYASACT